MIDGREVMRLAVLIDADNVSPLSAGDLMEKVCSLGEPIARRAYGMVSCFANSAGWQKAQREYGIVARPLVSNISGKNAADIALVIDAMEFLYKSPCDGIVIVSSDSDFTALATKIREGGKVAYGFGGEKTPASFRSACTKFFLLPQVQGAQKSAAAGPAKSAQEPACPRCGGKLATSRTKSRKVCRTCQACGGVAVKIDALKGVFAEEGLAELRRRAKMHEQAGCVCPECGTSMSLIRVAAGDKTIEVDICGKCSTIWYDKEEFEALVPSDGVLNPTVSAGKAFRRELALAVAADLRSGRRTVHHMGELKNLLKTAYYAPMPDVGPVIDVLRSQQVLQIDKANGKVTILK